MKVISYYTVRTPYESEYLGFRESCERYGIDYEVFSIESQGSWEKNCQEKAKIIRKALVLFQQPVVYTDIDSRLMGHPKLFETLDCDFAYHYLEHRNELLSGTLYFKNSKPAYDLLDLWIGLNDKNYQWDQKNLQLALEVHEKFINAERLPAHYCKIYDCHEQKTFHEVVIMHFQKSRQYRRKV